MDGVVPLVVDGAIPDGGFVGGGVTVPAPLTAGAGA
ncbi:MAG: hypothetical protein JWR30_2166, partial [Conexibacter sp.]|nr:hypothetical protein [Conexibacter sp.]